MMFTKFLVKIIKQQNVNEIRTTQQKRKK
jgi:hypothetical protein